MAWTRCTSLALIAAIVVAAAPPALAQPAPPTSAPTALGDVQRDLAGLEERLASDASTQGDRDDAARRLVGRQSDAARLILARTLQSAGNRAGQLAVAKALANDPRPDPAFINGLFALMGSDRALTDAAAAALGNYKSNGEVLTRLVNLAVSRQQRDARLAAIRALGGMLDKRAAETLVAIAVGNEESEAVRNAAADALVALTGLGDNARDPQRWRDWWTSNQGKGETQWRVDLLDNRATRFDQMQNRLAQMRDELGSLLTVQYQAMPETQRGETLLRYLKSAEPSIRAVAAQLAYDDAINSRPVPTAVREQLRGLIGDGAAEVRLAVARALQVINDPAALDPLLTQLAQEPDPEVRAEFARSLATIGDVRAVPQLVKLLADPGRRAAEAAAKALRDLGPAVREKDGALAAHVADALRAALRGPGAEAGNPVLREAIIEAMVVLHDPGLREVFYQLLDQRQREPTGVRRAAVEALGELRDPKVADVLATALDDRDEAVRLEAVRALGKTSTFAQAEAIYSHLSPNGESSERVRAEAWRVLQSLFPEANKEQLQDWARRFVPQPERRVIILKALADKQIKDKDEEPLALTRQNIGEAYMGLNQPADAAVYFRAALEYWRSRGGQEMVTQGLVRQTLEALLRGRQYDAAIAFAAPLIAADAKNQEVVGALVRSEAARLLETDDFAGVVGLVEQADKMTPALDARYAAVLHSLADEARQRLKSQDQAPGAGGPRSALLDAPATVGGPQG